jgi:hypothetical protein
MDRRDELCAQTRDNADCDDARVPEEPRRLGVRWVLGALCILGNAAVPCPVGAQCVPDTVGVPVSLANGVSFNSFGSAQGQAFWASDTLIESITIWRPANQPNSAVALGLNLFISKAYKTYPILVDCGVVRTATRQVGPCR